MTDTTPHLSQPLNRPPRSGDIYHLTEKASPQFKTRPILFRLIRFSISTICDGWLWIEGYEMNSNGDVTERRSLFVLADGLLLLEF